MSKRLPPSVTFGKRSRLSSRSLPLISSATAAWALLAATVLASLGFYLFPQVDLAASALFWNGAHFVLAKGEPAAFLSDWIHYGLRGAFLAGLVLDGILLIIGRQPAGLTRRKYLFVVLSLSLSAGLVTNVLLKDHWGRARPNQISEYGGKARFTSAWVISDQCGRNCSFIGGDVSFAACALAPAMLASRRRRWVCGAIGLTAVTALARLAAGGHFLSDCVIAAFLTWFVVVCLFRLLKLEANGRS